ncbi:MAG TPA: transcription elongation factor GreA [Candidatus Merdivicinus excrementipullorum]|uniref:Transcription elongation factor GreA n=1 Tax=Candidatus Merdivicinus excrementipullorum TaxID=2840867 RepID=A0A9D1JZY6_9FIRM|nr:transcription elongation factor GreA [Candidatus Merdivicinus excrementipullorum]
MAKETLLTSEGLAKLENELEDLKTIRRKEVADKIKVAISFGDLSENSEYDEAKNEQAMIEARILQIEAMLKNVKILDSGSLDTETVNLGSRVRVLDTEFDEEETFQIVGSTEANPDQGRISDESPIGKNLLGHRVDDIVAIPVPNGTVTYKILEIMM